ncbi:MAG: beta-N-acetylhexosaminidase, partial [Verrucomicrobiota bacterium]
MNYSKFSVLRLLQTIFVSGCLSIGLVSPHSAWADPDAALSLQIIPQPREVKAMGAALDASTARFIVVSDNAEDRFAARLLQKTARETHGIDCNIILRSGKSINAHRLWFGATTNFSDAPTIPQNKEAEGYNLKVDSGGVLVAADSDTGLFYGVQTLVQLLEQSRREKTTVPGMAVNDWPTFGWRARYIDASQYRGSIVMTRANLEREIRLLARYKLNALCIDIYNLVPFKSFPACADAQTLSLADWNDLVELAHRYHVTFMPSIQSLAQTYEVIWKCDEGKPYREATAPGLICPSRPENIKFLQGLYRDLISVFKYSPVLGIGCSEVGMQWTEHYCPLCKARIEKGETLSDIFNQHVRNCVQAVDAAAKEAGRPAVRPMMWGDEYYMGYGGKRWVGIENIPTNTIMGHWKYWKDYDTIAGLQERGFDVFFLSATYQHNIFLHDLSPQDPADGRDGLVDSGIRNIVDQARQAALDQQKKLPGKILGGGCATFSQHDIRSWDTTWFAYVLQAEYSWGDCQKPLAEELIPFTEKFAAIFYGANDPEAARIIASAYRELDAVKSDFERNNILIRD